MSNLMQHNIDKASHSLSLGNTIDIPFVTNTLIKVVTVNSSVLKNKSGMQTPLQYIFTDTQNIVYIDEEEVNMRLDENLFKFAILDASNVVKINVMFETFMSLLINSYEDAASKVKSELKTICKFLNSLIDSKIKLIDMYTPNNNATPGLVYNGSGSVVVYSQWPRHIKLLTCIYYLVTEYQVSIIENVDRYLDQLVVEKLLAEEYLHAIENDELYAGFRVVLTLTPSSANTLNHFIDGYLHKSNNGYPYLSLID